MPVSIYVRGNKIDITSKMEIIYNKNKLLIDFCIGYTGMCIGAIITAKLIYMMIN